MQFKEYQKIAMQERMYGSGIGVVYPALGLAGEAGEVVDKIKKVVRDYEGDFTLREHVMDISKELGDVLWYLTAIAVDLGMDLDLIAQMNIDKIVSRRQRGVIGGNGDNR